MLPIIVIILAILVFLTGLRSLGPAGIDIGFGGKLVGRPARIVGGVIIAFAVAMIAFALVGLPLLLER